MLLFFYKIHHKQVRLKHKNRFLGNSIAEILAAHVIWRRHFEHCNKPIIKKMITSRVYGGQCSTKKTLNRL